MKRDEDSDAMAQAEAGAFVEKWRTRAKPDGERSYPATTDDVREVAGEINREWVEPRKAMAGGQLQQSLADLFGKTTTISIHAVDDRRDLETAAHKCAARQEGLCWTAVAELRTAAERCRTANAELKQFQRENKAETNGREPRPRPNWLQRCWNRMAHLLMITLIVLFEAGAFLLLGRDAPREAIAFGLLGGVVSAAWLFGIRHLMLDPSAQAALGGSTRTKIAVGAMAAASLIFAWLLGCLRDALVEINNEHEVSLRSVLKSPADLSPDSAMIMAISLAVTTLTILLALGSRQFGLEERYRELWYANRAAAARYEEIRREITTTHTAIVSQGAAEIDALVTRRENERVTTGTAFGEVQRTLRSIIDDMAKVRRVAARAFDAYVDANREARAVGSPFPPASTVRVPHFDADPGFERDVLRGFAGNLEHARKLEAAVRDSASQVRRSLGTYSNAVGVYLGRLVLDPSLRDEPPRLEDILLFEQGPIFGPKPGGKPHPSSVVDFLNLNGDEQ